MDKYTIILKVDEIRRLVANKKYEKALKILETLDINKIRIITDLSVFADVFEYNKQYEKAIEILMRIYEKAKTRRVLFQLAKVYAKSGDYIEAEKYYDEFVEVAPRDSNRYILRYKLDKLEKKPLEELVRDLEAFKEVEYIEEWAYELAKLYYKAGYRDQCIKECSDIVLWFGEGIIVEKAKLLKAYYLGDSESIDKMRVKESQREKKEVFIAKESFPIESISSDNNPREDAVKEEILPKQEQVPLQEVKKESEMEKNESVEIENPEAKKIDNTKVIVQKDQIREKKMEDMRNFVAREELQIKGINISKEMKNFMDISGVWKQLTTLFHKMKEEDNFKHIIITGREYSGKTYLGKLLTKTLYQLGYINTPKLAMITGDRLNRLRLEEKQDKLVDGCVIIEKAGQMDVRTVGKVVSMMDTYQNNIIVILEDNREEMKQLILNNRNLAAHIHYSIELPIYSSVELIGFAKNYLIEHNVLIDSDLEPVLRNNVSWIMEQNETECLKNLIQTLSSAIELALQRDKEEIRLKAEDFHFEEKKC